MATLTGAFTRFVQDSQEYGSNDEHMVSRVFFDLLVDGKPRGSFHADVKLVVGGSFETDALEVGRPAGYRGPFDQARFADAVTRYIRGLVGSGGRGIRLGPGVSNIRMRNNTFAMPAPFSFEASSDSAGW
jgi:hypothetical protein